MIVGNPRAGRTMATIALALLFLILLSAAFVTWRKRTDPEQEPPLHPSTLIMTLSCKSYIAPFQDRTTSSDQITDWNLGRPSTIVPVP
jgi:hypothetical protein